LPDLRALPATRALAIFIKQKPLLCLKNGAPTSPATGVASFLPIMASQCGQAPPPGPLAQYPFCQSTFKGPSGVRAHLNRSATCQVQRSLNTNGRSPSRRLTAPPSLPAAQAPATNESVDYGDLPMLDLEDEPLERPSTPPLNNPAANPHGDPPPPTEGLGVVEPKYEYDPCDETVWVLNTPGPEKQPLGKHGKRTFVEMIQDRRFDLEAVRERFKTVDHCDRELRKKLLGRVGPNCSLYLIVYPSNLLCRDSRYPNASSRLVNVLNLTLA
jgi:hypothetical protein